MINKLAIKYLFLGLALTALVVGGKRVWGDYTQEQKAEVLGESTTIEPGVLAATTKTEDFQFSINVPARFIAGSTFSGASQFLSDIVAPNVLYSLKAGKGIKVEGSAQTPTITNTGVLSLNSKSGELNLTAGDGIELDGLKIKNTGILSLTAGDNISIDGNKITNTYSAPAVDYTQSGWTKTGTVIGLTTLTDSVLVDALTSGNLTITNGNSILPNTDLGSDLGSSSKRFNNLWVANINSNSSQSFSGQTTFSYAPTDPTITQASVLINPTTAATNGQLLGLGIAGYQRALIDEDGDLVLGYNSATSAPATDYPLDIYGHSGTRVSFVDASGNGYFAGKVGIGTVNPNSKLHVAGDVEIDADKRLYGALQSTTTSSGYIELYNSSTASLSIVQRNVADSTSGLYLQAKGHLIFKTDGNNERMRIDRTTGNVGIGTTAPTTKLHVSGATTGKALAIFDETGTDQALLTASASGVTKFLIDHSGQVAIGLGSTAATNTLEVNGSFRAGAISPTNRYTSVASTGLTTIRYDDNSIRNPLTLENRDSGAGDEGLGMMFNLARSGSAAAINAGLVTVQKELAWTSTASTQDSYLALSTTLDGSLGEKLRVTSSGSVGIGATSPDRVLHTVVSDSGTNTTVHGLKVEHATSGTAATNFGTGIEYGLEDAAGTRYVAGDSIVKWVSATGGAPSAAFVVNLRQSGVYYLEALKVNNNGYVYLGGDTTSYIGRPAANQFNFVTSNYANLLLTSSATTINSDGQSRTFSVKGASSVDAIYAGTTGLVAIGTASTLSNAALAVNGNLGFSTDNQGIVFNNNLSKSITGQSSGNEIRSSTYDMHTWYTFTGATYNEKLRLAQSGNLGLGTTSPTSKLHVSGAVTGKALAIFDETGTDQALFTASASGTTKFTVMHNGLVKATTGGLATFTKAGTISDTDFTDTAVDGLFGFDTTNHRLYFREGAAWSYIAKTGGFQIPNFEAEGLSKDDFLIPYVESTMSDGAVHGLYKKFSEVKTELLADIYRLISDIRSQIADLGNKFVTKESHQEKLCVGTETNETCITKEQLENLLIKANITPTPEATPSATPIVTPTIEITPTPESSPSGEIATSSANL